MFVPISWEPGDVHVIPGTAKMPPKYEVLIQEIDRLIIEVLRRAGRNPKASAVQLTNTRAREALLLPQP